MTIVGLAPNLLTVYHYFGVYTMGNNVAQIRYVSISNVRCIQGWIGMGRRYTGQLGTVTVNGFPLLETDDPNACSGHGMLMAGACACFARYSGAVCEIDAGKIYDAMYDGMGIM